ncbi:type II toxin-antitoxin system VapC family toxin [Burkholderia ambifaria]|nr:hypothetical protein [Burkholderia ambifaria]
MSVLVDTSVWVEHFRRPPPALVQLLRVDNVLTHPLVILELTSGTPLEPRAGTLGDLTLPRQTRLATPVEVAEWIERERPYGRGCGAVDCTVQASVLLTPNTWLLPRDQCIGQLAEQFEALSVPANVHCSERIVCADRTIHGALRFCNADRRRGCLPHSIGRRYGTTPAHHEGKRA